MSLKILGTDTCFSAIYTKETNLLDFLLKDLPTTEPSKWLAKPIFLRILWMHGLLSFNLDKLVIFIFIFQPGCVAQSVAHLTQEPEVPGLIPGLATYFRFSCC